MYAKMLAAAPSPKPIAAVPPGPPVANPANRAAPAAQGTAEEQHRQKSDLFARHAIAAFLSGKITRAHLADAMADNDAFDFPKWAAERVIHPSQAGTNANEAPEPPTPNIPR